MNDTKHTPGPWIICNGTDIFTSLGATNSSGQTADNNDGWQIADCGVGKTFVSGELASMPYSEQVANARLIAAAPELLEALEGIIEIRKRNTENPKYDGYYEAARAAIAKATVPAEKAIEI